MLKIHREHVYAVILILSIFLILASTTQACEWEGKEENWIPGLLTLQHGCCGMEGELRLVVCSLPIVTGRHAVMITLITVPFLCLAGFASCVAMILARRRSAKRRAAPQTA